MPITRTAHLAASPLAACLFAACLLMGCEGDDASSTGTTGAVDGAAPEVDGGLTESDAAPDATPTADDGAALDAGAPDGDAPDADLPPDAGAPLTGVTCAEGQDPRPAHWGIESHCKGQPPAYDRVFDDSRVHRIDLRIDAETHAAAMADLTDILGEPGRGGRPGAFSDQTPMWFEAEVTYDGLTWTHVGMRYKGNSSLQAVWSSGGKKLSFRFNFDKFEDAHPEIDNQRFFGFKKMTFSNGFNDDSLMRDKLAADLFRLGGVPAARGVFAEVHADLGEGPVYMGLYTMIEDPSDELLGVQFDDDSGNLYKPDGTTATWASVDPDDWVKETNEDDGDWQDVIDAVAALNGDRSDAAAWRATLEAHVDVDAFLRSLAINQSIVNWDSYGFMTHNYYVYADPSDGGRLVWFPWDLNEAMLVRGMRGSDPTEVMLDGVGASWPLIRFLLDDPVYRARYVDLLAEFLAIGLDAADLTARIEREHALIAPYVNGEVQAEASPYSNLSRAGAFDTSIEGGGTALLPHLAGRRVAVQAAIDAERP